ncbi:MAG: hypothetical protein WA101_03345, partial [Minisyncoccia bacterium]
MNKNKFLLTKIVFLALLPVFIFSFFYIANAANPGHIAPSELCIENLSCAELDSDNSYINFGCDNCDVAITSQEMTGYIFGENIGWINLSPLNGGISNTSLGELSGWAWGENAGWLNFNSIANCDTNNNGFIDSSLACAGDDATDVIADFKVSINRSTGEFSGNAWSQNYGWINFTCPGSACVTTDWRPNIGPPPISFVFVCSDES